MTLTALDDFAGTGWGVACKRLRIVEAGVEKMPEAVKSATRAANGMATVGTDVWAHIAQQLETWNTDRYYRYDLYIDSPPCQTFSLAGNGAGRKALDEVIGLIDSRAYMDVERLHEFGERHDPRTALVLAPLVRIVHDVPLYVVLEQVPPVLPMWQRMAQELEAWGYSTWTGILNAEQYGVPQTRKRAILIARADGIQAAPPTPTHSRYYSHDPARLDPGVLPWVSMAQALGWADSYIVNGTGANAAVRDDDKPAPTVHFGQRLNGVTRVMRSNYGTGGDASNRGERSVDEPAATVTSKVDRNLWLVSNDKLAHSARRRADEPAPTITAGHDSGNRVWIGNQYPESKNPDKPAERQRRADDLPAPTITSGSRSAQWAHSRPATTVAGDPRITQPGWQGGKAEYERGGPIERQHDNSVRVSVAEAAALQTYPADFDWSPLVPVMRKGVDTGKLAPLSHTKAFLQIGNAVPPTLAAAILSTFPLD